MELTYDSVRVQLQANLSLNESRSTFTSDDDDFKQTVKAVRYVINVIIIPILCLIGFAGNILNMVVLHRYGFKETNIMFLTSLSVADFVLTLFHAMIKVTHIVQQFDFLAAEIVGAIFQIYLYAPYQIMVAINVSHIITIAVERVIAVCLPFKASILFTSHRVKVCILFLYLFPSVLLLPMFFMFEHRWVYSPDLNLTIVVAVETQFMASNRETVILYLSMVVGNLFTSVVPLVIISCCFVVCVKLLRRRLNFLAKASIKETRNLKGMKMLLSVCLVAILISVPGIALINYCSFSLLPHGTMWTLCRCGLTSVEGPMTQLRSVGGLWRM
ncbi:hypothetical protein Btru_051608 [Bulinus truncatus]|nr:hypothetical protein Btru_051608 [Bulinus truncatus]